ncbi:hypothetical protein EXIGLDRAFT_260100 [Exidia glandulosa HHB12029]|uniref:Uncharacterized protein n=1 Tax=Exidia glandulosa HHB12029 TaxID=1314781 RepID=A0A166B9J3_EXIGL|nr:hypothetical protein EXIGLDRAFT_260100 [Exidia glandulosa HHB12029]
MTINERGTSHLPARHLTQSCDTTPGWHGDTSASPCSLHRSSVRHKTRHPVAQFPQTIIHRMSFKDKFHDTIEIVHLKVEHANAKLNPHSPDYFSPASHAESARVYTEVITTVIVTEEHKETWTHQVIALAAGFSSIYALEAHLRATGHEPGLDSTLDLLENIASSEVDKIISHKEVFWVDGPKARRNAVRQAHHIARRRYKESPSFHVARAHEAPAAHYKHGTGLPYRVNHVLEDPSALEALEAEEKKQHHHHLHLHSHSHSRSR